MPQQTHAISLQTKLIKTSVLSSVLAGICALLVTLGISVYQTMSIQDEIMDEIADMLMVSDLSSNVGQQVDELSEQFDIQYQLKLDQLVLTASEDFVQSSMSKMTLFEQHGYAFAFMEGGLYRVYAMNDEHLNVQLYQPVSARFQRMLDSLLSLVGVLILVWLIQWLILHFAIRKQFRSLKNLSHEISLKHAHDLTPIQQHEPELKELQPMILQLNKMLNRLDASLTAEQRFTADASHELRSPLSAIQMRLQVLKRKYQQPELAKDLDNIQRDVIRGTNVLENLLLLARLDPTDASDLQKKPVDLDILLQDVCAALEPFSREKMIQISYTPIGFTTLANQQLLFTAFRNVIDNAIRYSPAHSTILVETGQQQDRIYVRIINAGAQLLESTIQRLGERFYRELGTQTQGSGLGLSICKKIIELHQGYLGFERVEEGGLKVTITLPLA